MCGRKTLTKGKQEIISEFLIDSWNDDFIFKPSYNIAPTNTVPIMLEKNGRNILPMKWGLIPFWSNENTYSKSKKLINARSETLTTKSSFKNLISQNRCVVISDGYYEWKKYGKNKIPFYIQNFDNNFLLMAGLYNIWKSKANEKIFTYTIITTKSNNELSFI
ncbi:MAG: SOS response-associated peptidase, partial [Candidatus Marinimicrobia bacterium]|nr:SOS response-associated peptidase [Candidatus Neomarinimicrobiota bacterium]